jgi:hypothetical protein
VNFVQGGAAFSDGGDTVVFAGDNWWTNHGAVVRKYSIGTSPTKIGPDWYGDTTAYWAALYGLGTKKGFGEFRTVYTDHALQIRALRGNVWVKSADFEGRSPAF